MRDEARQLRLAPGLALAALTLAACGFEADYGGADLRCPDGRCPDGFTCSADARCVRAGDDADGAPPDGPPDAGGPDAPLGVCDKAALAPDNDGCGAAIDLTAAARAAGGATVHGDTTGYGNDVAAGLPTCTGILEKGPDAIYKLTGAAGAHLVASVAPEAWNVGLVLLDGCASGATCLDGADALGTGAESVEADLTGAGPYYLVVDSFDTTAAGCFTLSVTLTGP